MQFLSLLLVSLAGQALGQVVDKATITTSLASATCAVTADATPSGFNCGGEGNVENPAPLGNPTTQANVDMCGALCLANYKCESFSYTPTTGDCILFHKVLVAMQYKDRTTPEGNFFYNYQCFQCTSGTTSSSSILSSSSMTPITSMSSSFPTISSNSSRLPTSTSNHSITASFTNITLSLPTHSANSTSFSFPNISTTSFSFSNISTSFSLTNISATATNISHTTFPTSSGLLTSSTIVTITMRKK